MRILIINHDWFVPELRARGHEVMTIGTLYPVGGNQISRLMMSIQDLLKELPGDFKPDRIVYLDNSAPLMLSGFEYLDIPALFYSVDAHHHASTHKYVSHLFDHVLLAQRDFTKEFQGVGIEPEWMPLWASKVIPPSSVKKHGAVFVGTLNAKLNPDRVAFFEALQKKVPMVCTQGEWPEIFPVSQMVINQTVKGDLNFRVFEAMVTGTALLTEDGPNGLRDLFVPDKHLLLYQKGNIDQAAATISDWLSRPSELAELGANGRAEILKKHLPEHRAQRIEEILLGLTSKKVSPIRHAASFANHSALAWRMAKLDGRLSGLAMSAAMKSLNYSFQESEPLNEELSYLAAVTGYYYDKTFQSQAANELLLQLADRYPHLAALEFAVMRRMLNDGRIPDARERAARVNPEHPEGVFDQAEMVMRTLIAELWPTDVAA